jgi:hypothetical protein
MYLMVVTKYCLRPALTLGDGVRIGGSNRTAAPHGASDDEARRTFSGSSLPVFWAASATSFTAS